MPQPATVEHYLTWTRDAACRDSNVDFFPSSTDPWHLRKEALAKAVCRECPAKPQCLSYALANNEVGIWAGTTHRERYRIVHGFEPRAEPVRVRRREGSRPFALRPRAIASAAVLHLLDDNKWYPYGYLVDAIAKAVDDDDLLNTATRSGARALRSEANFRQVGARRLAGQVTKTLVDKKLIERDETGKRFRISRGVGGK